MNASKLWALLRSGVVVSILGALNGCSDRSPVSAAPGSMRDAAPLPMPPNAVTATLDSFPQFPEYDPGGIVHKSFTTPTITVWGFYNWYQYFDFGPGHNAFVSRGDLPSWFPLQVTFGKPVSRVRIIANSPNGSVMKCPTRTGEVLSVPIGAYLTLSNFRQLFTIDVSGPGILNCFFEGYTIIASITIVPEPQVAKLVLTCSPGTTVQRGTAINCTAGTSPAGAVDSLKISQWTFEGRPRMDGDRASREWNGVMVTGGMIRVQGTVQGTAVADSAQITVTARSWPPMQAVSPAHDSLSGDLPATPTPMAPTAVHPFGYDLGSLAHSRMQRVNLPFVGLADSVIAGPNTGWSYVKSPLAGPYFSVNISAAFAHTSAWYQQQHYGSPGGPAYLPYCTKPQIDSLRMRAELHEGLRQTPLSPTDMFQPTNNHYRFFKDWIATNDPNNKIYEPLVWNADSLAARVSTSADEYMTQIWAEMVESPQHTANVAAIDYVSVNLVPINCRAR